LNQLINIDYLYSYQSCLLVKQGINKNETHWEFNGVGTLIDKHSNKNGQIKMAVHKTLQKLYRTPTKMLIDLCKRFASLRSIRVAENWWEPIRVCKNFRPNKSMILRFWLLSTVILFGQGSCMGPEGVKC